MVSIMWYLLLVSLLAVVLVNTDAASINGDNKYFCKTEQVLLKYNGSYWCFQTCEDCPNGFCHKNKCYCFPGMLRDEEGNCEQICKDCENGWCSSVSECKCNEGFAMSQGRCVSTSDDQQDPDPSWELPLKFSPHYANPTKEDTQSQSCQTDYIWDPKTEACIPYESAEAPKMNVRMDD